LPLTDPELPFQESSPAISEEVVFRYYREQELAKEAECDSEGENSDGEFGVVIGHGPIASHCTRLPSPVADDKSKYHESGGDNDGDGLDEFEEVMRRGFAEATGGADICSAKPFLASLQRMTHQKRLTPAEAQS
jgi:hypothetical protein